MVKLLPVHELVQGQGKEERVLLRSTSERGKPYGREGTSEGIRKEQPGKNKCPQGRKKSPRQTRT